MMKQLGLNCTLRCLPHTTQASFQRSNSHDKVRRIVAEEGRAARNLIAWSVPLESKDEEGRSLEEMPPAAMQAPQPRTHTVHPTSIRLITRQNDDDDDERRTGE